MEPNGQSDPTPMPPGPPDYPDYGGVDALIFKHPEGPMMRLDPAKATEDTIQQAETAGWERYIPAPDVEGERTGASPEQIAALIASGVIRDPDAPEPAHATYDASQFVVEVPVLRADIAGEPMPPAEGR